VINRLVLIGNGFDIANGLKSKYSDFIDNYWNSIIPSVHSKIGKKFENEFIVIHKVNHFDRSIELQKFKSYFKKGKSENHIVFKNKLFKLINSNSNDLAWFDIEHTYFLLLENTLEISDREYQANQINKLNKELLQIKNKLIEYLNQQIQQFQPNTETINEIENIITGRLDFNKMNPSLQRKLVNVITQRIYDYTQMKTMESDVNYDSVRLGIKNLLLYKSDEYLIQEFFHSTNLVHDILESLETLTPEVYLDIKPFKTHVLNFNYTSLLENYYKVQHLDINNIHGQLVGTLDPIFGYGDERHEKYRRLEETNLNGHLENIKSINYLESNNVKRLDSFIDSGRFEVYIFGHSCGISDRTLLSNIFENENCVSVRIFYHQKDDSDNFIEVVQNISRNFTDKIKLRRIVLDKTKSTTLIS